MNTIKTQLTTILIALFLLLAIAGSVYSVTANRATTVTISYVYDDAGRLTEASFGDDAISYTYDNNGNLLQRVIGSVGFDVFVPTILK